MLTKGNVMRKPVFAGVACWMALAVAGVVRGDLESDFKNPPASAKPHTWWHWMDGNVGKEGITQDLEAMKRVGIGGFQLFDVGYEIPRGKVDFFSPTWREMVRFAGEEAERLGLEMCLHNCSGWSSSGGPWVTPALGMQTVVMGEVEVQGGEKVEAALPMPVTKYAEDYHDIAVLAVRRPAAEGVRMKEAGPGWSASVAGMGLMPLEQAGEGKAVTLPGPMKGKEVWVEARFKEGFAARGMYLKVNNGRGVYPVELQVSEDGAAWKTVASQSIHLDRTVALAFEETRATRWRLRFASEEKENDAIVIRGFDLTNGYRLPEWGMKANFADMREWKPAWAAEAPQGAVYGRGDIVDVTEKVKEGRLTWEAPEGAWTILRVGYAPNGRINKPATAAGEGLEIDKLSKRAVEWHFEKFLDVVLKDAGARAGKTLTTLLVDSYETGPQNWTAGFREEFLKRRGYDLLLWLPALTGRVIESPEVTERFLFDLRKTVAELFQENYYAHFRDLCRARGLRTAIEPYDGPFDTMEVGQIPDLPMSEFWNRKQGDSMRSRYVVSAARFSGHEVVGAESFTASFSEDKFVKDPWSMKVVGDAMFCQGINRFIFHRFAHQPWAEVPGGGGPGMTMGPWGAHMERTATWWEQGKPWMEYIARCQTLLQQGQAVGDVLCFTGEQLRVHGRWGGKETPPVPVGYGYEFVNAGVLARAQVEGGKILVVPVERGSGRGMSYQLLVLPDGEEMTLGALETIARLVKGGAGVVGPKPKWRLGLEGGEEADRRFAELAAAVWGKEDRPGAFLHPYGQGQVYRPGNLELALRQRTAMRDFEFKGKDNQASGKVAYLHRATAGAEIYFVSNQGEGVEEGFAQFRVAGKSPKILHPETGMVEVPSMWMGGGAQTIVKMTLGVGESAFVVFGEGPQNAAMAVQMAGGTFAGKVTCEDGKWILRTPVGGSFHVGMKSGKGYEAAVGPVPAAVALDGAWKVKFQAGRGAPESATFEKLVDWSKHEDAGIRYFSGTATYTQALELPESFLGSTTEVVLDLGEVKNLAQVVVNGQEAGTWWKPPFAGEVTRYLRPGINSIEVKVTNMWANRLIGDEELPDDCAWVVSNGRGWALKEWPAWLVKGEARPSGRKAFATWKFYEKGAKLMPSGLMGPVVLRPMGRVELK